MDILMRMLITLKRNGSGRLPQKMKPQQRTVAKVKRTPTRRQNQCGRKLGRKWRPLAGKQAKAMASHLVVCCAQGALAMTVHCSHTSLPRQTMQRQKRSNAGSINGRPSEGVHG